MIVLTASEDVRGDGNYGSEVGARLDCVTAVCDAVRLLAARGENVGGAAPAPGSNLNGWGSKGQSSEAEDGGDSCELHFGWLRA